MREVIVASKNKVIIIHIFFLLSDPEDVEYEDVVSVLRGITLTERERVGQVKSQHSFSPRPVAI